MTAKSPTAQIAATAPAWDEDARPAPATPDGVVVVNPALARLDASTAPALREQLLSRIEAGARALVLDLSGVSFLDSAALGALIAAAKRMAIQANPKGRFAVGGVQPAVARLFALTHMDRVFAIHPTLGEAVAHLSS